MTLKKIVAPLLAWYDKNARALPWRENADPYRVWVSEIMLQQTRVDTVVPYYTRFLDALPTVGALAQVDDEKLLKLWEGLGYYSRARNLKKAARVICERFNGVFPSRLEDVAALPGVGAYTAGAICSIAFEQPTPAVDGNVLRVTSRLTERITDKAAAQRALKDVYPAERRGAFTQSLMELGALVCLPTPDCDACPLKDLCGAHRHGTQAKFPPAVKKAEKKTEALTVFLLRAPSGALALTRRPDTGLLRGQWQLPNVPGALAPDAVAACLPQIRVLRVAKPRRATHIFTHIKWQMTVYAVDCAAEAGAFTWVSPEALAALPLPTAFRKLL